MVHGLSEVCHWPQSGRNSTGTQDRLIVSSRIVDDLECRTDRQTDKTHNASLELAVKRSSATALCQSESCQPMHSISITNRSIMKLEGYSRPTCNKLHASIGVIYKLYRRRVLLTARSTCLGEIYQVQSLGWSCHRRTEWSAIIIG